LKQSFNTLTKTVSHPLFVYAVIASLCCIKLDEGKVYDGMPNKGDNFRTKEDATIYYFSGIGKYKYDDADCYFSKGNPPFGVEYEQGGVKTIDNSSAEKIPLMGTMCSSTPITIEKKQIQANFADKYLTKGFLLANFSELAHLGFYMALALSILLYYPNLQNKYLIAFILCLIGGIILEIVQHFFIMGRQASWEDLLLNTIGSFIGMLFFKIWGNRFRRLLGLESQKLPESQI
jgi:hypothetical protein